jgi:hypothetical protein
MISFQGVQSYLYRPVGVNQSPRIKPTLINGEDANPKAVENQRTTRAAIWN